VPVNWVPFDLPVGSGGTITSGIYVLTRYTQYAGADGGTGTGTQRYYETLDVNVSGSTATVGVFFRIEFVGVGTWADWDWAISSNSILLTVLCSDSIAPNTITYTATADEIRLYWGDHERVFTRL
jgi:hypothetical protein